jgi:hypothetical protein
VSPFQPESASPVTSPDSHAACVPKTSRELAIAAPSHHPCHGPGDHIPSANAELVGDHPVRSLLPSPDDGSDEETLDGLAVQIQQAHAMVARASLAVIAFAVTAGRLLCQAREHIPAGSWGEWVEEKCEFSVRTAQDYMRVARALDEGLIDPQHAAGFSSLRKVLAMLRKNQSTGQHGQESALDDWSDYPDEFVADLIAWKKARQRLIDLTKQLSEVKLAGSDLPTRELFRQLVIDTILDLWRYGRRPQENAEGTP